MNDKKEMTDKKGSEVEESDNDKTPAEEILESELLNKLPADARKIVEVGMMSMHRFSGPMSNPITQKINEKHIDKILELSEKDDERAFKDASQARRYTLAYVIVFVLLFIFVTVFLVGSDKELYKEVIKLLAVYLGGLGSGFGIKSYIDRNK